MNGRRGKGIPILGFAKLELTLIRVHILDPKVKIKRTLCHLSSIFLVKYRVLKFFDTLYSSNYTKGDNDHKHCFAAN